MVFGGNSKYFKAVAPPCPLPGSPPADLSASPPADLSASPPADLPLSSPDPCYGSPPPPGRGAPHQPHCLSTGNTGLLLHYAKKSGLYFSTWIALVQRKKGLKDYFFIILFIAQQVCIW